jgi:UDP-glucose 4-epimerase
MSVAVVGASSFIATTLLQREEAKSWRFVSHAEALTNTHWLNGIDTVLNCAFDNRLKVVPYDRQLDVDLHLAEKLALRPRVRFVMLSSRLVYGPAPIDSRLAETLPPKPTQVYGKAKLITEVALHNLLGKRLTVLRLSNIFGEEYSPGRQNFIAIAMRSLLEKERIFFDMSPFVSRDFLPVNYLIDALIKILLKPSEGVFNIGAGHGTAVGKVALWLISGYGRGTLLITDVREHDSFWLDIDKAQHTFDLRPVLASQIQESCVVLGAQLQARIERRGDAQCA